MRSFSLSKGHRALAVVLDNQLRPHKNTMKDIYLSKDEMFFVGDLHFDPVSVHNGTHDPDLSAWSIKMAKEGYAGIIRKLSTGRIWLMVVPYSDFEVN